MISYRGGDQARADLFGGRVHINIAPTASLLPLIRDGKARAVAFTGIRRSPDLPDVPTTAESGYPSVGYNPDVWLGLFAPRGTPDGCHRKAQWDYQGKPVFPGNDIGHCDNRV